MQHAELRRDGDFVEDAVNADADAEVAFEGLDVDIGGAFDDGFADDLVDEFDDAGLGVVVGDVEGGVLFEGFVGAVVFEDFLEDIGTDAIGGAECAEELGAGGELPADFFAVELLLGEAASGLVEDVVGGEGDGVALLRDGEDVVLEDEAAGQELQREAVYFLGVNRLARSAEDFAQLGGEFSFVGFAGVEDFDCPGAAAGGFDGEEFGGGGVVATGGEQRVE